MSYNGGRGGIGARPTARQETAMRERRFGATSGQTRQASLARNDRRQWASENHGHPGVTASQRAGEFGSRSAEARNTRTATETRNHAAETRPSEAQSDRPRQTDRPKLAGRLKRTDLPRRAGLKRPGPQSNAIEQMRHMPIERLALRKQVITLRTTRRENRLAQHIPTLRHGRTQQRITTSITM